MSKPYNFPWVIEPDDWVIWTNSKGKRHALLVTNVSYRGKKGVDDCVIEIIHSKGKLECLPCELSNKFRFKVVRIDETDMWSEEIQKRASKLTGVYIYNNDEQTYCCELTPSFWLEFIHTEPKNYPEDEQDREQLLDELETTDSDISHYRHVRDVERLNPKIFGDFENMDEAREYAQSNCGCL